MVCPCPPTTARQITGWVTNASVLAAVAREIKAAQAQAAEAEDASDAGYDAEPTTEPPNPLPGYRVVEVTLADGSPAADTKLGDILWPAGFVPVSVLRDRNLRQPDPRTVVRSGDRIALLTPDGP
jgi:hypothetical protein